GVPEDGNNFAKTLWVFSKRPPSFPIPGAIPCQTPFKSRGLKGIPGGLNFTSALVCSGVRHCGHVFQPGGGNSVWANAFEENASPAPKTNIEIINRLCTCCTFLSAADPQPAATRTMRVLASHGSVNDE